MRERLRSNGATASDSTDTVNEQVDLHSPNFDPLARPYRWLEYLSMGPYLERCRFHWLPKLKRAQRALVYGDGDGRFLVRLLAQDPSLIVDAVDISAAMLRQVGKRVLGIEADAQRLHLHHADARSFTPPRSDYDLVVAHFFLDCFNQQEIAAILQHLKPSLAVGATALISDFAIPPSGAGSLVGRTIVWVLYRIFGLVTGLRTRRLPNYAELLVAEGFVLMERKTWLGGLLVSELWRFGS